MNIAGFDIGGANTDVAVVDFDGNGKIKKIKTNFKYLPMWTKNNELEATLLDLLGPDISTLDAVSVCMTAELVDNYKTKREGVIDIISRVKNLFNIPVGFVGLSGILSYEEVLNNPIEVAAANWIASAQIASRISAECILIDVGSTTTDIIPIRDGLEIVKGRSDLERLGTGELVYTGALRTNLATIVDKILLNDQFLRVSSELFSISADMHLILDNINQEDYTCDTPDGTGKSKVECMRRISRLVCGDLDTLGEKNIENIAKFIYNKQLRTISEALLEVSRRENISKVVTTGLGMEFLGSKAAKISKISSTEMNHFLNKKECIVAPAIGSALMMEKSLRKN
jgi:(4-(4-[2-(gamma-L-glutamylamino)ethyl]phenoxymethyl)furan-2-yl)methanamine synthase